MEYTVALEKAWTRLQELAQEKNYTVRFLANDYSVDLENKQIFSSSDGVSTKTYYNILILHYLIQKLKGLPQIKEEWISFRDLAGGQGYYPTFKKRVIDTIVHKYGVNPQGLLELTARFSAKRAQVADISIALDTFEQVPVLLTFWGADSEFGPEVNLLFDKSISEIFCTEDVVVLAEIVAHSI